MADEHDDGMVELRIDVDPEVKVAIEAKAAELGVSLDDFVPTLLQVCVDRQGKGGVWIEITDEIQALLEAAEGPEDRDTEDGEE